MIKIYLERRIIREDMAPSRLSKHPGLRRLYSLYEEEGELAAPGYIREELPPQVARRLASTRMLELLGFLLGSKGLGVSEVARRLERSPSNVSRDLNLLAKWRIIRFVEQGRRKVPEVIARKIEIIFAEK
jgi:DNA-binding transcriptional ArsR family regulator